MMWEDFIVVFAFLLYLGAGFATNYIITDMKILTDAAIQLESNPVARSLLNLKYGIWILQTLAMSLIGGIYWMIRKKYKAENTQYNKVMLEIAAIMIFIIFLRNFLNDFPIALKLMGVNI